MIYLSKRQVKYMSDTFGLKLGIEGENHIPEALSDNPALHYLLTLASLKYILPEAIIYTPVT